MSYEKICTDTYERAVVLVNPNSTRAKSPLARQQTSDIRETFGSSRYVEIQTTGELDRDKETISSTLQSGDVLSIGGGDGATHIAIQALASDILSNPEGTALEEGSVPIFSLGLGNGNDFAWAMNGEPGKISPTEIIARGERVAIFPIQTQIKNPDGEVNTRLSASYTGLGIVATVAEALSCEKHRLRWGYNIRLLRTAYEGLTIAHKMHQLTKMEPFTIAMDTDDGVEPISLFGLNFNNGPLMAKYGQLPIDYEDPRIFVSPIIKNRLTDTSTWLLRLATGTLPEEYREPDEQPLAFTLKDDTFMHFDAEAMPAAAGTHFTIGKHVQPFYALRTTQPKINQSHPLSD